MSSNTNKNTAQATDLKALAAVAKYFGSVPSVTLAGTSYTPAELKGLFQGEIDANHALDLARAQLTEQVASTRVTRAKLRALRKALKAYILGTQGAQAVTMLQDFGFSVPKTPGRKTVKAKAEAIAKAEATRAARHTMGSKEKQSIHGAPEQQQPAATTSSPQGTTPASPAPNGTPSKS